MLTGNNPTCQVPAPGLYWWRKGNQAAMSDKEEKYRPWGILAVILLIFGLIMSAWGAYGYDLVVGARFIPGGSKPLLFLGYLCTLTGIIMGLIYFIKIEP